MENHNSQQDIKIAQLETKVDHHTKSIDVLSGKINNLIGNHFPTLRAEVSGLKATQKITLGLTMAILLALIALFIK